MNSTDSADSPTRRSVVKTGAGLLAAPAAFAAGAAVLARPRQADAATQSAPTTGPARLRDPRTAYPRPPFPAQSQEAPGLASKMEPKPDHGEQSYVGSGRLMGRKALVTGGDSGIGRAAVIAFAREGADVAVSYLPSEEADAREVAELIRDAGRKAVLLPGDISDEAFCQKLVADAVAGLGGLDILVNNAGRQHPYEKIEDLPADSFEYTFKVNVFAPFWITKAAVPHLPPGATVINTASVQAYDPSASLLDYAQTKACNVAFTKSLSKQMAKRGVRVNAVAPGPIWTPIQIAGIEPEGPIKTGGDSDLGRPGQPAELAAVYVHLASPESSYTTGEVYAVPGGSTTP